MKMIWNAACSLALLALGSSSPLAQESPFEELKRLSPTTSTPPGSKGRALAGDVTGDLRADLVYLDANQLWLVFDIATTKTLLALQRSANDIALIAPSAAHLPSRIACVDSQGLHILADYGPAGFAEFPLDSGLWGNAQRVLSADLDLDGELDLVGVAASQQDLLIGRGVQTPNPSHTSHDLPGQVLDLLVADWSGSDHPEVVVLSTAGLHIYDQAANLVQSYLGAVDAGALSLVRQQGYGYARCAIAFESAGQHFLQVVDAERLEPGLPLATVNIPTLASADVDRDGDDDLLMTTTNAGDAFLSLNRSNGGSPGGSPTFGLAQTIGIGAGDLGPSQAAWPALYDFDDDGDADLLLYSASADEFIYYSNKTTNAQLSQLDPRRGKVILDDILAAQSSVDFELDVQVPGNMGFVEVLVWPQETPLDFTEATLSVPVFQGVFSVGPGRIAQLVIELGDQLQVEDNAYYLDLRPVDGDPLAGTISAVGPSTLLAFALEQDVVDGLTLAFPGPTLQYGVALESMRGTRFSFLAFDTGRELLPVVICIPFIPPKGLPPLPVPMPCFK